MKKVVTIIISILVFAVGLGVMFYPTISNWFHAQTASYAISDYLAVNGEKTNEEFEAEFADARAYNASLSGDVQSFAEAEADAAASVQNLDYWNTFDQVSGIMGIIEIPTIDVTLPIYHGSEEDVLQKGVGHLEGSALPTGDVGNHTILTGHTGLPTAMLFTDLDELVLGDYFYLEILNQVFVYEVANIYVVLPSETEQLVAQADKDLVTLVTCTPYGVNSHRLLIQGQRTDALVPDTLVSAPTEETVAVHHTVQTLNSFHVLIVVAVALGLVLLVTIVRFSIHGRALPKGTTTDKPE